MTAPQILRDRAVTFSGKVQRFLKQNVGGAVMPAPYVVTVNQENPPSVPEGDTIIVNCPIVNCQLIPPEAGAACFHIKDKQKRRSKLMANVHVLDHPLIQHKLAILRDKNTGVKEFRELIGEIAGLMCYEATRNLPTREVEVETPVATAKCRMLAGKKLAIVPVLRAGLGMVDNMVDLIPSAKIGHIGLYRDPETHQPVEYYCKLPDDIANRQVFVVDPMLATGGSAVAAIDFLKKHGCRNIIMMNIIGCPEGIKVVQQAHPDVELYLAAVDEKLNDHAYIVPGLGDAGDRIFGTK